LYESTTILKIPYRIHKGYNLFSAHTEGAVTFDDLYLHVLELMSDPYFQSGLNGLYDFTKVTSLTGNLSKWHALAEGMSDNEILPVHASTSIVLPRGNQELLDVMMEFLALTANSQIDYRIFDETTWQDALKHVEVWEFNLFEEVVSLPHWGQ
jgi:hypothetical protein